MLESSEVPLNSSSKEQCHVPDGAATGGSAPAQPEFDEAPALDGPLPGDGAFRGAGVETPPEFVDASPVDVVVPPPPAPIPDELDENGEAAVVVVVGLPHRATISRNCVHTVFPPLA